MIARIYGFGRGAHKSTAVEVLGTSVAGHLNNMEQVLIEMGDSHVSSHICLRQMQRM